MWFPVGCEQCASHQPFQLFKRRFHEEEKSEWYLQSGAAATVKAVSIAAMLVDLITSRQPKVKLTTDPSSVANRTIVLYEAFVAGKFKTPQPQPAILPENEWDAFTASLAWGAKNGYFNFPPTVEPHELHRAGSSVGRIASVWQIVANLVASKPQVEGPLDCQIVGLGNTPPTKP